MSNFGGGIIIAGEHLPIFIIPESKPIGCVHELELCHIVATMTPLDDDRVPESTTIRKST